MKRDLYFKELAVVLGRAGFTPLPQEFSTVRRRWTRLNENKHMSRLRIWPEQFWNI